MVELLGLSKTIIFFMSNSVKPSFFHSRIARTQQNHHFFHVKLSKTLIFFMVELLGLSKTIIFSFQNSVKPSFFHGRIARTQQNHHFFHVKLSKTLIFSW